MQPIRQASPLRPIKGRAVDDLHWTIHNDARDVELVFSGHRRALGDVAFWATSFHPVGVFLGLFRCVSGATVPSSSACRSCRPSETLISSIRDPSETDREIHDQSIKAMLDHSLCRPRPDRVDLLWGRLKLGDVAGAGQEPVMMHNHAPKLLCLTRKYLYQ